MFKKGFLIMKINKFLIFTLATFTFSVNIFAAEKEQPIAPDFCCNIDPYDVQKYLENETENLIEKAEYEITDGKLINSLKTVNAALKTLTPNLDTNHIQRITKIIESSCEQLYNSNKSTLNCFPKTFSNLKKVVQEHTSLGGDFWFFLDSLSEIYKIRIRNPPSK
jgi:hypothetical protein